MTKIRVSEMEPSQYMGVDVEKNGDERMQNYNMGNF